MHLEDFDALTVEENHRLAVEHFDAERFFQAHEAWETCWKQMKRTEDAEFFKGLSQLGAGYVHLLRGNQHGAYTLLRRGAGRISKYENPHREVKVRALATTVLAHADQIEEAERQGRPGPSLEFPKI